MASPPKKDRRTAVLLLLVLVAFLLIVGIAAYYILNRETPAGPAPFIDFGSPEFGGSPGDATVNITDASREVSLSTFRVSLRDLGGGTTLFDVELHVGTLYSGGGAVVSFEDLTSTGTLSVGDLFRLINLPTGVTYSLILVYEPEGRTVASVTIPL